MRKTLGDARCERRLNRGCGEAHDRTLIVHRPDVACGMVTRSTPVAAPHEDQFRLSSRPCSMA
jgi:hypothetical protein